MLWESLARVCVGEGGGGTSIMGVCKPLLHVYVCGGGCCAHKHNTRLFLPASVTTTFAASVPRVTGDYLQ